MDDGVIISARPEHLEMIARCHQSAFPASLASRMGLRYLKRMLGWYLSSDKTFLFFVEDRDGTCIGYCGGMLIDGRVAMGSASSMTQFSFEAGVTAILLHPWLLFHPELLSKYKFILKNIIFRLRRLTGWKMSRPLAEPRPPHASIVVIGVAKEQQGKGYGSVLMGHFDKVSIEKGYRKVMLTVLSKNAQAIKAYERNGWHISRADANSTSMEKSLA